MDADSQSKHNLILYAKRLHVSATAVLHIR